jgi:hypothetical protein
MNKECLICMQSELSSSLVHCRRCVYQWCQTCDKQLLKCPYCRIPEPRHKTFIKSIRKMFTTLLQPILEPILEPILDPNEDNVFNLETNLVEFFQLLHRFVLMFVYSICLLLYLFQLCLALSVSFNVIRAITVFVVGKIFY